MKKLFLAVTLSLSIPASAQPDEEVVRAYARSSNLAPEEIRKYYDACDSGVSRQMQICAGYSLSVQEVRLAKAVGRIKKQLYAQEAEEPELWGNKLERMYGQAQEQWIRYRAATCEFEGFRNTGGGSDQTLYSLSCMEQMTKDRIEMLEAGEIR